MNNRIANFGVKKITREDAREDRHTFQVGVAFAALYTTYYLNYELINSLPPPPPPN